MSAMSIQEACNAARQFAVFVRAFGKLAEVADVLESSDQQVSEHLNRVASLQADADALAAQNLAAQDALAAAGLEVEAATAQAAAIIEAANVEAATIAATCASNKAVVEAECAALQVERQEAVAARDAALAEEAAVLARIEEAKAAAHAIFG
jgi:hypothetical protein